MKKLLRNKQIVLGALVMVIVVAGAVNWAIRQEDSASVPASLDIPGYEGMEEAEEASAPEVESSPKTDYFASARLERDQNRSKELEIHRETINNDNSTIDAKKEAEQEVKRIALAIENESVIESLIKAKDIDQVVAYINKDSVNIIVSSSGLLPTQVAQIKDIVIEKTGFTADKIKIIEVK